ncbi:MAG: right-handed parallel beta-helix repeat-containing protein [Clostridia bacterium]|nr:right-handed parallel beta-helix repeat-containing protein [Clostridia bacterium]
MAKKVLSVFIALIMICGEVYMAVDVFGSDADAIYVSAQGSDGADGSFESPLATIAAAKELAMQKSGDVTVYFRQGSYTLLDTVNFTSDDKSGVTYKAYNDEKVVFTAGTPYSGFENCTVNGVKAVKKYVGKGADFNILFNEKTMLKRTRYPESGYLYIKDVDDRYCINPDLEVDTDFHKGYTAFTADKKDIPEMKNPGDAVVRVLHFWKDEMLGIKNYDSSTGLLQFTKPSSMTFHKNERYFIENVFEALNEPGEWYLDKCNGVLYYIPQNGETADNLTLRGSDTETLITVDGVDNIKFENIIFRGNGFNVPQSRDFSQAAYDAPVCVSCRNAEGFEIKNCEFRDIAACAVFLGENVQNARVDSCIFENIGAQAVYIRGENLEKDNPLVTKNIDVVNNLISGFGRVFFNAVGILIIHANSVNACNNEIHDGYYTAVSVGWMWGYSHSITYNNRICDNLIYNIGQGWLSDMGGIYTLGNQKGTVLSGNVIHNVAADPGEGGYGGWGIYLDEGSSSILVENNLTYACASDGYHLHYGSDNTVRNNIFALNGESQVRVVSNLSRVEGTKNTAAFENNIILCDGRAAAFSHLDSKEAYTEKGNIIWDISNGDNLYFTQNGDNDNAMSYETAKRKGWFVDSTVADPMFKDAVNFDFELSENSPAFKKGFNKIDYTKAGTKEGTKIGVSLEGGKTPYNADSVKQPYTPSRERFHALLMFWYKIVDFFGSIFKR